MKTHPKAPYSSRHIDRILDANLNRAREGLRVIEEIARFAFVDAALRAQCKNLRHRISRLLKKESACWVSSRDASADHGAFDTEKRRRTLHEMSWANFRRTEEALRVIEELMRLSSASKAGKVKRIRFTVYTIEKKFLERFS